MMVWLCKHSLLLQADLHGLLQLLIRGVHQAGQLPLLSKLACKHNEQITEGHKGFSLSPSTAKLDQLLTMT